jgi:transcriptional regulator with XRE-family HTH domain
VSILGQQLRAVRLRHGVSQRSLARRAATTQRRSAASSPAESPSFERFTALLLVLGERLLLATTALEHDLDPADLAHGRRLSPEQRLAESPVVEARRDAARDRGRRGASAPAVAPARDELHVLRDVPGAPACAELRWSRALVVDLDGSRSRSPGSTTSSR